MTFSPMTRIADVEGQEFAMLAAKTLAGKRTPGKSVGQICDRTQRKQQPRAGQDCRQRRGRTATKLPPCSEQPSAA